MPTPKPHESESSFVSRAVPRLMDEGRPQRQAVAIAYSLWRQHKKRVLRRKKSLDASTHQTKTLPAHDLDTAQRDDLPNSDFGDPERRKYPIRTQQDVDSASHLVGFDPNPAAVKKRIIEIARKRGLRVPAAWERQIKKRKADKAGTSGMKNMGEAVSPAMSSVDVSTGGAFRGPPSSPSYHWTPKPFHRRKLKRKGGESVPLAVGLKRNEAALVEAAKSADVLDPLTILDRRTKDFGPGWSYKLQATEVADASPRYGLDVSLIGTPQYDEESLSITFVFAASHGRDRVGDFLDVAGIDTSKHRLNPVAYIDHGKWHPIPVGKCESPEGDYTVTLDAERGLAIATVYLDRDETTANGKMARQVFSLFKQRILRAGSIGYRPSNKPKILPAIPERGIPQGLDLTRTELLEVTICGLPANGDAVNRCLQEGWHGKAWEPPVRAMLEAMAA